MASQLEEAASLRPHLDAVLAGSAKSSAALAWYSNLEAFLRDVHSSIPGKLKDPQFLIRLWDDNPVSAIGNGTVKVAPALEDASFVDWFAAEIAKGLPESSDEVDGRLTTLYDELATRLGKLCGRTPRLKLNRVLCAIFPHHFTTIADVGALLFLHREMGGTRNDHPVHAHIAVRRRIEAQLPSVEPANLQEMVRRMCLPWLLYERITGENPSEVSIPDSGKQSQVQLTPLPATLRKKGLTAMKGGFPTLLGLLPALDDGLTREEFIDVIHQANPDLAPQSIGSFINVVAREFDLCVRENDVYRLSARGINLLQSQDPQDLADHLLTRILSIDHIVRTLSAGPKTKVDLVPLLQSVNPGWTSSYAPTAQLGWMVSLGAIRINAAKQYELTDMGRRWDEMITWEPELLPKVVNTIAELKETVPDNVMLPTWEALSAQLKATVAGRLAIDESLVKQLHAGLWFHPVRHFVVLTGISGSGKTQVALNYALSLCGVQAPGKETVKVIPIQPGWFEPSPLLGYVNPIQQSAYRSAPFLELLLRASENPTQPHVAILDEMNLSHPEQYLAPILSAMETHGSIDLHQLAEETTEVPRAVQYPANLAIIGTINMDETTCGLSDKVLDRAYTLEFWNIKVSEFPRWNDTGLPKLLLEKAQTILDSLATALAPVRLHFGWRTIDDVINYLRFTSNLGVGDTAALDDAVYAKVLPKLRGENSKRFELALQQSLDVTKSHGLVRCQLKLLSMQSDLAESGTTRFWR